MISLNSTRVLRLSALFSRSAVTDIFDFTLPACANKSQPRSNFYPFENQCNRFESDVIHSTRLPFDLIHRLYSVNSTRDEATRMSPTSLIKLKEAETDRPLFVRILSKTWRMITSTPQFLIKCVSSTKTYIVSIAKDPSILKTQLSSLWKTTKYEAKRYWIGSKLLWSEINTTRTILGQVFKGQALTRREHKQLRRTTADLFRLIPFLIFVIVPFLELLLPLTLTLFPNMLPSTFTDKLKREEDIKKQMQMRLALAGFMKDILRDLTGKIKLKKDFDGKEHDEDDMTAAELIQHAKDGKPLSNYDIIRLSRLFRDSLTLDNLNRPQLIILCKFMNMRAFGSDELLRYFLRSKIRDIHEDDRNILWEGLDTLNDGELVDACRERGMKANGLTMGGYKLQLQQWLELSVSKSVPVSLMILSRAFSLEENSFQPERVLQESIQAMDNEIINEIVLESASADESRSADMRKRQLESILFQNELIEEERLESMRGQQLSYVNVSSSSKLSQDEMALVDHMETIVEMSQEKPMETERERLHELRQEASEASAVFPQSSLATESAPSDVVASFAVEQEEEEEDKNVNRLNKILETMFAKIEIKLDMAEAAIGDRLALLDKDKDGILNAQELRDVLQLVMTKNASDDDIKGLVELLDKDHDGKISVKELMLFVEKRKEEISSKDV